MTQLKAVSRRRGARIATLAVAVMALSPAVAAADVAQNQPGWSATTQALSTGITQGYELAVDTSARRLYAADAGGLTTAQSQVTQVPVYDANGEKTGEYTTTTVSSTAKVVALNTINNSFVKNYSFLTIPMLTVPNRTPELKRGAFPYGVAVDSQRHLVVTTNTRSNSVTIFDQNAGPLDAASTLYLDGAGAEQFAHPMSVGVDSSTGRAYVADNQAHQVEVIDLATKTVIATIPDVPSPTKFAVDEANSLAYVGSGAERGATLPVVTILDLKTNTVVGTLTSPNAGDTNTRPGLDTVHQKLYVGSYAGRSISVYDLATRTFLKRIDLAGPGNTVTVDSQRHLAYSADHSANTVTVIDTTTDQVVQVVPTFGARPIAVAIDPASGVAYASSQSNGTVTAIKVSKDADLPKGDKGDAGAPGATGPAGPAGPAGPGGVGGASTSLSALSLTTTLGKIKVVGASASIKVPGAGTTKVVVVSGPTTIATGTKTSAKAGTIKVTLKRTAAGKKLLGAKKNGVSAKLTATFTPKQDAALKVARSVKVKLTR